MFALDALRQGHQDFLAQWKWDWHVTLTFDTVQPLDRAVAKAKRHFLSPLKAAHPTVRFASIMLATSPCADTPLHIHALLVSDKCYPQSLLDLDPKAANRIWPMSSTITTAKEWSNEVITAYLTKPKNMTFDLRGNKLRCDFFFYRPALLDKLRRPATGYVPTGDDDKLSLAA